MVAENHVSGGIRNRESGTSMSSLDQTLANLAPGVSLSRDLSGRYNPRHGLAIYFLPIPSYSPSAPGMVLGEALAARSGLGCTLLDGVPEKVPEGAVVIGDYAAIKAARPDLLDNVPELTQAGQYAIKLQRSALIVSPSVDGLANGMQTLAMLVLRHNEDTLPGTLIADTPFCHFRGLAVELQGGEIGINLLMQMASFAATFKANCLQIILDDSFDPMREVPGIEAFVQTCQSYGIGTEIRVPWLSAILSGKKTLHQAWTGIRAAARLFGADSAALDDPCPAEASDERILRVMHAIANGEVGLKNMSVDATLAARSGLRPEDLRAAGVGCWLRVGGMGVPIVEEAEGLAIRLDVQSHVPGFSGGRAGDFRRRLDQAIDWLDGRPRRELMVSFRNIGISHMWQNLLYPAATGLIAAWGNPRGAERSAWIFANLLYGDSAEQVMDMWELVGDAFPQNLAPDKELLVRQTAFGSWPTDSGSAEALSAIDWLEMAKRIRAAAESLKNTAAGLSRNVSTLAGAKLSLHALSWLHCFAALVPELERRRRGRYNEDGRTEPIATELYNNFQAWHEHLESLYQESGLEIAEMPRIESMGLRLKGLCDGIFE